MLKLSEAIRLGAMLGPQSFGTLSAMRGWFKKRETTCALGAAFKAAGCKTVVVNDPEPRYGFRGDKTHTGVSNQVQIPDEWLSLMWQRVPCPACTDFQIIGPLQRIVAIHLNDKHHWTREQIADWVATLEAQQEVQAEVRRGAEREVVHA